MAGASYCDFPSVDWDRLTLSGKGFEVHLKLGGRIQLRIISLASINTSLEFFFWDTNMAPLEREYGSRYK